MSKKENKSGIVRVHLTEEQIIEVGTAYRSGTSVDEISSVMEIKVSTIRNCITALRKAGVEFPKRRREQSLKYRVAAEKMM